MIAPPRCRWPFAVTLTSIPPRFRHLGPTLRSILDQAVVPGQVILYIPRTYRRFPEWDGVLPEVPEGVIIRRTEVDFGPATKILPAVRDFAGRDVDLLFCDDDRRYDRNWTRRFQACRADFPDACIVEAGKDLPDAEADPHARVRSPRVKLAADGARRLAFGPSQWLKKRPSKYSESGYCDTFLGYAGVLVQPGYFSEAAFDIPEVLWTVDDFWLSGQLELSGIPIWLNSGAPRLRQRRIGKAGALLSAIHQGHDRVSANTACVDYFRRRHGIWGGEIGSR